MRQQAQLTRNLPLQRTHDELDAEGEQSGVPDPEAAQPVAPVAYRLLGEFRYEIRRFLAFSERAARRMGIEPQQHQLLLAVKGLPVGARPTIRTIAERLCVQHHTTVALVDKLEKRAFVVRERSTTDKREVLLRLTPKGETILRELSVLHQDQLASTGAKMVEALSAIVATANQRVRAELAPADGEALGTKGARPAYRRAPRTVSEPGRAKAVQPEGRRGHIASRT